MLIYVSLGPLPICSLSRLPHEINRVFLGFIRELLGLRPNSSEVLAADSYTLEANVRNSSSMSIKHSHSTRSAKVRAYLRICVHGPRGYTSVSIGPSELAKFCALARGSARYTEIERIREVVRRTARGMLVDVPRGRFSSAVRRRALATLRRSFRPEIEAEFDQQQFPDGVPTREM